MNKTPSIDLLDVDCVTLSRFLISNQINHNGSGRFSRLMDSIQTACKAVSNLVRRAGMMNLYGLHGDVNPTGDKQQKLDILSNLYFMRFISRSKSVSCIISEENEQIINYPGTGANYIVALDPLDGSSNIECLASIGTIFAIYWNNDGSECNERNLSSKLSGRNVVAAGYTLYGSATMMVLAIRDCGVNGFTLDSAAGEFVLTDPKLRVPRTGPYYSINEGYECMFESYLKDYIHFLKYPESGPPRGARYVGSMVSDLHRTMKYGGIFIYPPTRKAPKGKLRLLYEAFPMAFIFEMASGQAVTPDIAVLDVVPQSIHDTCPLFIGSEDDVAKLLEFRTRH